MENKTPPIDSDLVNLDKMMDVNVKSVAALTIDCVDHLVKSKGLVPYPV